MDLTGDGYEEAVWLDAQAIEDSGSGVHHAPVDVVPRLLQTMGGEEGDNSNGRLGLVSVDRDGIVLSRPIVTIDDAECCPSAERIEVWRWRNTRFVEDVSQRRIQRLTYD
ncbi:MAG: hypothetical protein IPG17_18785 [Sandaracinaceae bacterium]|nr:hypothetical protein [Sandaracinaceae bacterium]